MSSDTNTDKKSSVYNIVPSLFLLIALISTFFNLYKLDLGFGDMAGNTSISSMDLGMVLVVAFIAGIIVSLIGYKPVISRVISLVCTALFGYLLYQQGMDVVEMVRDGGRMGQSFLEQTFNMPVANFVSISFILTFATIFLPRTENPTFK